MNRIESLDPNKKGQEAEALETRLRQLVIGQDDALSKISSMSNQPIVNERLLHEAEVAQKFLEAPNEDSFSELFNIFTPQLVAFFRARNCELALAEDLA